MTNENVDINIVLPILKRIPLFSSLDENLHREIVSRIVMMYYPKDYTLFKEGDEGDALYIIKTGQVEIFHNAKEEGLLPEKVATINENGFFGEMALISDAPRNASAKAVLDTEMFILNKTDFNVLLKTSTALAEQISAAVVDRTNKNQQKS